MKTNNINGNYFLITAFAVFLSFELHELCHFFTGEFLGNKMAMTLNSGYPVNGYYLKEWHFPVVSAAGPLFTLLQALLFYSILKKKDNYYLYPFLFSAFFLRFSAMLISFKRPNDEARISEAIGIGRFTLPLLISAFLFFLVYKISRQYKYSKKLQVFTLLFVLFFYSAIILVDKYFHVKLL
jgi:hypothetical protein